jgi:hypothetical protein
MISSQSPFKIPQPVITSHQNQPRSLVRQPSASSMTAGGHVVMAQVGAIYFDFNIYIFYIYYDLEMTAFSFCVQFRNKTNPL